MNKNILAVLLSIFAGTLHHNLSPAHLVTAASPTSQTGYDASADEAAPQQNIPLPCLSRTVRATAAAAQARSNTSESTLHPRLQQLSCPQEYGTVDYAATTAILTAKLACMLQDSECVNTRCKLAAEELRASRQALHKILCAPQAIIDTRQKQINAQLQQIALWQSKLAELRTCINMSERVLQDACAAASTTPPPQAPRHATPPASTSPH